MAAQSTVKFVPAPPLSVNSEVQQEGPRYAFCQIDPLMGYLPCDLPKCPATFLHGQRRCLLVEEVRYVRAVLSILDCL